MNKLIPIYIYGIVIILQGIFILLFQQLDFQFIKWVIGVSSVLAALLALIAAFYRREKQVQLAYHELHSLMLLIYGIVLLYFCNSLDRLIFTTILLFLFYSVSEIVFCNWLFNLSSKLGFKVLFVRLIIGLFTGMGAVWALALSEQPMLILGALFMLVGVNIVMYVPIVKANYLNTHSQ
jgi:uncharacterized membrane protein HdeD (DUF308 family)